MLARKGARKPADVPREVLALLEKGEIETVNLSEWLALDQRKLIGNTFPAMGLEELIPGLETVIDELKKATAIKVIEAVGEQLSEYALSECKTDELFEKLSTHPADTVRCYAPYLHARDSQLVVNEQLEKCLISVSDAHFGVREVAWMALRPSIAENLSLAIPFLEEWTRSMDENVRRFTTEATRPRGVWCTHIGELKEHPELALPLLEMLKADPARYVQNSVANWLNDASKTRPDFVSDLTQSWLMESEGNKATAYIVKRARRSLGK
ncbi:DNA alkylation repair protein [Lewinellaceae bacterium SD302]|nr:DNA alkylation repair protein [Lewinellaceae bacterium SD302]